MSMQPHERSATFEARALECATNIKASEGDMTPPNDLELRRAKNYIKHWDAMIIGASGPHLLNP